MAIGLARPATAEVIDRVLAVVNGTILMQSDVYGAMALGLVNTAGARDPVASALEQLIERELVLAEVDRYAPPEPSATEIAARAERVRARFPTQADYDRVLASTGLTDERLRVIVRDQLRMETYLGQRFGSAAEPTEEQVVEYYRAHQQEYTRDGVLRPFAQVQDEVRARLIEERRATLIADWIAGLRRRADVTIHLPQRR